MPKAELLGLSAEQFALFEKVDLEFDSGFTVFTGETGAGKTLLIGAIELCIGNSSNINAASLSAEMKVSALFRDGDGAEVVLSRQNSQTGRLRAAVNHAVASAESLRALAEELIVIHGQHDSLRLRTRSAVLELIDLFGAVDDAALQATRRELASLQKLLLGSGGAGESRTQTLDFLAFQIDEISKANIKDSSELDEVLERLTALSAAKDSVESVARAVSLLRGDEADTSPLDGLALALSLIPTTAPWTEIRLRLSDTLREARESVGDLDRILSQTDVDGMTVELLEGRASQLQSLCRKYGGSLEAVLATFDQLSQERMRLVELEETLLDAEARIAELRTLEQRLEGEVLEARRRAARSLEKSVTDNLARVAMPNATISFDVGGRDGAEISLIFTPNPGHLGGPLDAVASGGELSRLLLAISLATEQDGFVAIFDEIDAGIGGQTAQQIGGCLRELSRRQQVFAITHLPSVASQADHHFVIEKTTESGTTKTQIRRVEGATRAAEIARMLSGDSTSSAALALAEQMLQH